LLRADAVETEVWSKVAGFNKDGILKDLVSNAFDRRTIYLERLANDLQSRLHLAEQLEKLDRKRSAYQDQQAEGLITMQELRAKVDRIEDERAIVRGQLDTAAHADAERLRLELMRTTLFKRIEDGFFGFVQKQQTPQEVHASYREMDLRVEADAEGEITLSGNFGLAADGRDTDQRSSPAPPRRPLRPRGPR
jgi:hypothetical protein